MMSEINITKVNDLYEIEQKINQYFHGLKSDRENILFYRGQADYSWKLEPGIKREPNLKEWEQLMGYEDDCHNIFDFVAKCQHYGKKTRFLDFTTDINIALFFACNEHFDKDGCVYICPYPPRKAKWHDTIIISELTIQKEEITVDDFSRYLFNKYKDIRDNYEDNVQLCTYIVSWLDHGFMVMPDKNEYEQIKEYNKRLYNQKGAFFICGNKTKKPLDSWSGISSHAGHNIIIPTACDVPSTISNSRFVTKVKIPVSLKKDILKYLDEKGINFINLMNQ